ncbi:MAG: hypothetical protein WBZ36_11205, partial [Candidatus Nitrosopolaris sp.]
QRMEKFTSMWDTLSRRITTSCRTGEPDANIRERILLLRRVRIDKNRSEMIRISYYTKISFVVCLYGIGNYLRN